MVDPAILQKLDVQDWEELYPKLVHYAAFLCKFYVRRVGAQEAAQAMEANDFAQKAIELVYTGKRQWRPNEVPDLLTYLKGVVRSLVSHWVELRNYTQSVKFTTKHGEEEDFWDGMPGTPRAPSVDLVLERKEIEDYLRNWAGNDEILRAILSHLFEGMKRAEIAKALGLPLPVIDNQMKRIRRAVKKFLNIDNA